MAAATTIGTSAWEHPMPLADSPFDHTLPFDTSSLPSENLFATSTSTPQVIYSSLIHDYTSSRLREHSPFSVPGSHTATPTRPAFELDDSTRSSSLPPNPYPSIIYEHGITSTTQAYLPSSTFTTMATTPITQYATFPQEPILYNSPHGSPLNPAFTRRTPTPTQPAFTSTSASSLAPSSHSSSVRKSTPLASSVLASSFPPTTIITEDPAPTPRSTGKGKRKATTSHSPRLKPRPASGRSTPEPAYVAQLNPPPPDAASRPAAYFQCNLCPKRFTRALNLRAHLRAHTDERPFLCAVCGKSFARQHDRKRHERLHVEEGGEREGTEVGSVMGVEVEMEPEAEMGVPVLEGATGVEWLGPVVPEPYPLAELDMAGWEYVASNPYMEGSL